MVVVLPSAGPTDFCARFIEVWRVIASWGRWVDDGEWPDQVTALAQLPGWFRHALQDAGMVDIPNWMDDLHDRSWTVASVEASDPHVRITLDAESLPLSAWPVVHVCRVMGGRILHSDVASNLPAQDPDQN